jgi:hypothetical protein
VKVEMPRLVAGAVKVGGRAAGREQAIEGFDGVVEAALVKRDEHPPELFGQLAQPACLIRVQGAPQSACLVQCPLRARL